MIEIEIELDSAVGARVLVWGLAARASQAEADDEQAEIEAAVPKGWSVSWDDSAKLSSGGTSWALVPSAKLDGEDVS